MERMKEYFSTLCNAYSEVILVDTKNKINSLVYSASTPILFIGTDAFSPKICHDFSKKYINEQEQNSFCEFLSYTHLQDVCKSAKTQTAFFHYHIENEEKQAVMSLLPYSETELLCTVQELHGNISRIRSEQEDYELFCRYFVRVFNTLFDGIVEFDPKNDTVSIFKEPRYHQLPWKKCSWQEFSTFLYTVGVHEEDFASVRSIFSHENLLRIAAENIPYSSVEGRILCNGAYRWMNFNIFCITVNKMQKIIICNKDIDKEKLLHTIVEQYVYNNCDYFIYLNVDKNSYTMFSYNENGTPVPAVECNDYSAELELYAQTFVAPEDIEMCISEMQLTRIVEQLEIQNEHSFTVSVLEHGEYRRKRLQYVYYDKRNHMVLLTRTDITDMYEEEKRLAEAQKEARTDSLTGLYNHKAVLQEITKYINQNGQQPATLIFMDLDNFKQVNDNLGHQRGDALLQEMSKTFTARLRPNDILGRIGGDEFLFFLPGLSGREEIEKFIERLRTIFISVLDDELRAQGVSFSMGIAAYPQDGTDCTTLVRDADAALYTAKRLGKNKYFFAVKQKAPREA